MDYARSIVLRECHCGTLMDASHSGDATAKQASAHGTAANRWCCRMGGCGRAVGYGMHASTACHVSLLITLVLLVLLRRRTLPCPAAQSFRIAAYTEVCISGHK